ncbi:MAG: DUF308 domain-containing protein [Clostridia bacterium]|nr:DUF308 domain-containing protein [Clostridia bacterium]
MNTFKKTAPVILLFLLELVIGIFLLTEPEKFTKAVFIAFGVVLITIGVIYLVRYLADKKNGENVNVFTLAVAISALILGAVSALLFDWILKFLTFVWVIYGIIIIVSGVYKAKNYVELKKNKQPGSALNIVSILISLAIGVVLIVKPFEAILTVWRFAGIALIIEGFIDFALIMLNAKPEKTE